MALSWWGKGLWQICMHHWTGHAKVEFPRFPPDVRMGAIPQLLILNSEMKILHWYLLMGFPLISSALQPFQICIFNRKNSKLTFSNGSQLMGKRFMANLHASLDRTCKSSISKISTRWHNQGGPFHNFWSWTQKCKFCIDIFYRVSLISSALQPF